MSSGNVLMYAITAFTFLFYSVMSAFGELKQRKVSRVPYAIYILGCMATVGIEILAIMDNLDDNANYLLLFYTVAGPIIDRLFSDWPRSGAAMVVTAQIMFIATYYADIYGAFMIVTCFYTVITVMIGLRAESLSL